MQLYFAYNFSTPYFFSAIKGAVKETIKLLAQKDFG